MNYLYGSDPQMLKHHINVKFILRGKKEKQLMKEGEMV